MQPAAAAAAAALQEALQEQYPATTTEWAEPLLGDGSEVAALRPMLACTQLERLPLRLAFDANRDGWDGDAFHTRVDGFGAALVVATTQGGAVCGGYNPRGEGCCHQGGPPPMLSNTPLPLPLPAPTHKLPHTPLHL